MQYSIRFSLVSIFLVLGFQNSPAQIFIQPGATFTATGNAQITLDGTDFINNGTFQAGTSTFLLKGTGATPLPIGGNNAPAFHNLVVELSGPTAQLSSEVAVQNQLTFTNGYLDLNGFDLTLGANGDMVGESDLSSIIGPTGGEVVKTVALNAPNAANPGHLGVYLTSSADLGPTTIRRGHVPVNSGGTTGLNRYFEITPTNNAGLDATLRFEYLDSELSSHTETELELWQDGGSGFQNLGFSLRDATLNFVETTGLNALSTFTVSDLANALPVELLDFTARAVQKDVLLNWQTFSETNNRGFEVQRSGDGQHWQILHFEAGNGTTTDRHDYSFLDKKPISPLMGGCQGGCTNFYRLRQVDFDGKGKFSRIVQVTFAAANGMQVFPNPVSSGALTLVFSPDLDTENAHAQLFNAAGQLVKSATLPPGNGQKLEIADLPAGWYWLQVQAGSGRFFQKVMVQK